MPRQLRVPLNITFTNIPLFNELEFDFHENASQCLLGSFKQSIELAPHYLRNKLPPDYAYYMRLGNKTLDGNWTDLALVNPISMFILGCAIVIPLLGIIYVVFLQYGFCGAPLSGETRVQRKWRWSLCVLMLGTLLYTLMGLGFTTTEVISLLSLKAQLKPPPSLDELANNTRAQVAHITTVNKQEFIDALKAFITAEVAEARKQVENLEPHARTVVGHIELCQKNLKYYQDNVLTLTDENYPKIVFLRDLFREFCKIFTDYIFFTDAKEHIFKDLNTGDLASYFLNPKQIFNYQDACQELKNVSRFLGEYDNIIKERYESTHSQLLEMLTDYGDSLVEESIEYVDAFQVWCDRLLHELDEIRDDTKQKKGAFADLESAIFAVPQSLVICCFVICFILFIILLLYVVALVVGMLAPRCPRCLFGFNKYTAAIAMRIAILATFIVYPFSVYQGTKLFFWALIMQRGVCDLSAIGPVNVTPPLTPASVLHSCKIPKTVYTHLVTQGYLEKMPTRLNIDHVAKKRMVRSWESLAAWPDDSKNDVYKKLKRSGHMSDTLWPNQMEAKRFSNNYFKEIYDKTSGHYITFYDPPESPEPGAHKQMKACLRQIRDSSTKYMETYVGEFINKWDKLHDDYYKTFKKGIQIEISEIRQTASAHPFYRNIIFRDNILNDFTLGLNIVIDKFNYWVETAFKTEIGQCGLFNEGLHNELKASCECLMLSLNGAWTGFFLVFFCLPLLLIVAIALSNNLRKVSADYHSTTIPLKINPPDSSNPQPRLSKLRFA